MSKLIPASCLALIVAAAAPAHAQVTLDVAKITCDQFTGYKITNPQNIAIWAFDGSRMLTALRRLCGHDSIGPREVCDQS